MTPEEIEPAYAARAEVLASLTEVPGHGRDVIESAFRLQARALELRACGHVETIAAAEHAEAAVQGVLTVHTGRWGARR